MRGYKDSHTGLTVDRLREVLRYNRSTGEFTWKVMLSWRGAIGKVAGWSQPCGRIKIAIDGVEYMAHRLAWLYVKDEWPPHEVDHKDLNRSNNRWRNLRLATSSENLCNRRLQSNNTSGYKGVHREKRSGRFIAYIKRNRKRYHLGMFDTAEEAYAAHVKAAKRLHGDFANV